MTEIRPGAPQQRSRGVGALRSTLIGFGVLAFTFFPPTRTLMLWGVGVQIARHRRAHPDRAPGARPGDGDDRR